ncbi:hypothetical protein [Bradyrhizobium pachyrhizi]|uniref:hypothetical protein n=1 Tax=Bradyrhizobium pachyrhizi TaxID=280333 RepID=UPI003D15FE78
MVAVMAPLARLYGLMFPGGIGEYAPEIRQRSCDRLSWLGISNDTAAIAQGEQRIAAKGQPGRCTEHSDRGRSQYCAAQPQPATICFSPSPQPTSQARARGRRKLDQMRLPPQTV